MFLEHLLYFLVGKVLEFVFKGFSHVQAFISRVFGKRYLQIIENLKD
jgi:hypothetical protein